MITVTDHAVLRLLERAHGLDVEAIRSAVAARVERAAGCAAEIGERNLVVSSDGVRFVLRHERVITVLPLLGR